MITYILALTLSGQTTLHNIQELTFYLKESTLLYSESGVLSVCRGVSFEWDAFPHVKATAANCEADRVFKNGFEVQ